MKLRAIIAMIAVIAVPVAVQGENAPARKVADPDRVVCEVAHPPGSRLGGVRTCRTRAEWAQYRADTRDVVHRIQSEGATFCNPDPNSGPHC